MKLRFTAFLFFLLNLSKTLCMEVGLDDYYTQDIANQIARLEFQDQNNKANEHWNYTIEQIAPLKMVETTRSDDEDIIPCIERPNCFFFLLYLPEELVLNIVELRCVDIVRTSAFDSFHENAINQLYILSLTNKILRSLVINTINILMKAIKNEAIFCFAREERMLNQDILNSKLRELLEEAFSDLQFYMTEQNHMDSNIKRNLHWDIAKLIIAGANPNIKARAFCINGAEISLLTFIYEFFHCGNINHICTISSLLLFYGANHLGSEELGLMIAALNGNKWEVSKWLNLDISPDGIDDEGTPLILACSKGNFEIVKILLKAGANVDVKFMGSQTPLIIAAKYGHTKIVKILLKWNASIEEEDIHHETALTYALKNNHKKIEKLIDRKRKKMDEHKRCILS